MTRYLSPPAIAILGLAIVCLVHSAVASAQSTEQELLRMQHEFELGNGEKVLLVHHRHDVTLRICVNGMPGEAPLKVDYDGQQRMVMDGSCADITGRHIEVAPGAKLPADDLLVGRFRRTKGGGR